MSSMLKTEYVTTRFDTGWHQYQRSKSCSDAQLMFGEVKFRTLGRLRCPSVICYGGEAVRQSRGTGSYAPDWRSAPRGLHIAIWHTHSCRTRLLPHNGIAVWRRSNARVALLLQIQCAVVSNCDVEILGSDSLSGASSVSSKRRWEAPSANRILPSPGNRPLPAGFRFIFTPHLANLDPPSLVRGASVRFYPHRYPNRT